MSEDDNVGGRRARGDDEHPPWWADGSDGTGRRRRADDGSGDAGASADTGAADADVADAGTEPTPGDEDFTAETASADVVSAPPPPPARDRFGTAIRGIGQTLITLGVVVLLFVVYELWVTNLFGEYKQAEATEQLDKLWSQEADPTGDLVSPSGDSPVVTESGQAVVVTGDAPTKEPDQRDRHYDTTEGSGFAKMYVPAFGADFSFTIIEGVKQVDLYKGPGHYPDTQYPGEPGNFSLAGHRVNKGAPFDDLGLLNSCDAIVVETRLTWYVYRVLPMQDEVADWDTTKHAHCDGVDVQTGKYKGVYGRDITSPADYAQVLPVPHVNSMTVPDGAEALMTMTTCHPKFSDRQRMIIHSILVKSYPKSEGFLPPELEETS